MAIDGTTIKARKFIDEDTGNIIEVNLSVRDIIFFKLLENIASALRNK